MKKYFLRVQVLCFALILICIPAISSAQTKDRSFSLQVSPTPIVETFKPGETRTVDLRIHNTGSDSETLKIETRKFTVEKGGEVVLSGESAKDIESWIAYSSPIFTISKGEWFTQKITVSIPQSAAFSYSFAFLISRAQQIEVQEGKTRLEGSVAVFALFTIDKPGATRKAEIVEFSSSRRMYEYLPADFKVVLKNSGNSILKPYGNVYIQRKSGDTQPISVLKLNESGGYLLPGVERSLDVSWKDGFPHFEMYKPADNQPEKRRLVWNWAKLQDLRVGKYTARVVAVYNDGARDVPVQAELTFWVIPWKILIGVLVLLLLALVGTYVIIKRVTKTVHKRGSRGKGSEVTDDSIEP